jgi:formate hydrogenlyase subunit 3/multisubunit Na+/H+ antiporter MnhD subunit
MDEIIVWLVALPLAGALLTLLLPSPATLIAIVTGVASTIAGGILLYGVGTHGALYYEVGGWTAGLGIAMRADGVTALLLMMNAVVLLAAAALAAALPARRAAHVDPVIAMRQE